MNNGIYEVTSQEKIYHNIDQPLVIQSGGELKCYGNITADAVVEEGGSFRLYGDAYGDVLVMAGGVFHLYGVSKRDISVKDGGVFHLYGSTEGNILLEENAEFQNHGAPVGQILREKDGEFTEEKPEKEKASQSPPILLDQAPTEDGVVTVISLPNENTLDTPSYLVTGEETSFKAIPDAITVKCGGCFRFFGVTPKTITVENGGTLHLFGMAGNGICGEGHVEIHGIVNGKIAPTLDCVISPGAIVNSAE